MAVACSACQGTCNHIKQRCGSVMMHTGVSGEKEDVFTGSGNDVVSRMTDYRGSGGFRREDRNATKSAACCAVKSFSSRSGMSDFETSDISSTS